MSRWLCLKIGYPEIWWLSWSHIFRTKNSLFLGVSYHLCRQTRWRFTSSVSLRFPVEGTLDQRDLWVQYGRETTEGAAEGLDEIRCCSGKKHLGTPPEVTWVLVEHRVYLIPQNLIVDHHVPHWKSLFLLGYFQRHPWSQVYTDLVLRRDRQGIRQIAKRIQNEETWKVVYKQIEQVGEWLELEVAWNREKSMWFTVFWWIWV